MKRIVLLLLALITIAFGSLNAATNTIAPGETRFGTLVAPQTDFYTFTASSNDTIYLTAIITNRSRAFVGPSQLYLYDPDGILTANSDFDVFGAAIANFHLRKTGMYTVAIIDTGAFLLGSSDYLITINLVAGGVNQREIGDGPEALLPGETSYGHIDPNDYDTFTFNGTSNSVIYLTLFKTNGPGVPSLHFYNPHGFEYTYGLRAINDYRLTETGVYIVGVVDHDQTKSFDYKIRMIMIPGQNLPEPDEGANFLTPGETRSAQITEGDLDEYTFPVIAGDDIIVTLSQTSGFGVPFLYLYGSDGALLDSKWGSAVAQVQIRCSPQYGPFTIVCGPATPYYQAYTYDLLLVQSPSPPSSIDPSHPYLAQFQCDTSVVTRWPTNAAGFELQFCDELCATNLSGQCYGSWTNLPPPYPVIGEHYYVTNRSSDPMRFYRLTHP